jgi:hypothetical protein
MRLVWCALVAALLCASAVGSLSSHTMLPCLHSHPKLMPAFVWELSLLWFSDMSMTVFRID